MDILNDPYITPTVVFALIFILAMVAYCIYDNKTLK